MILISFVNTELSLHSLHPRKVKIGLCIYTNLQYYNHSWSVQRCNFFLWDSDSTGIGIYKTKQHITNWSQTSQTGMVRSDSLDTFRHLILNFALHLEIKVSWSGCNNSRDISAPEQAVIQPSNHHITFFATQCNISLTHTHTQIHADKLQ